MSKEGLRKKIGGCFLQHSLKVLEEIQKMDLEIGEIEGERESLRSRIGEVEGEIEALEAEQRRLGEELDGFLKKKRDVEEQIRLRVERIRRDEKRTAEIRKDREYGALLREINNAKREREEHEFELLKIEEEIAGLDKRLEAGKAAIEEKRGVLAALTSDFGAREPQWDKQIAEVTERRKTVMGEIKPLVLKTYERIKEKRGGLGLVPVKDEICQGCYINIPPQVYIRLMRGDDELITCPHCHRILYFDHSDRSEAV
ncbi:MAG TPA: hypothetical protein ENJ37_03800 [Deltaproteobacteria bacterium]|nr:hypothetical protein [Deltaproteobacteria bacterium]